MANMEKGRFNFETVWPTRVFRHGERTSSHVRLLLLLHGRRSSENWAVFERLLLETARGMV